LKRLRLIQITKKLWRLPETKRLVRLAFERKEHFGTRPKRHARRRE
jgi:hypothetical protein